jgi:hypothetical protein
MKASEARRLSKDIENISGFYKKAMKQIKDATSNGLFECWVYDEFPDELRKRLVKDGYKVGKTQFDRNDTLTKISWL